MGHEVHSLRFVVHVKDGITAQMIDFRNCQTAQIHFHQVVAVAHFFEEGMLLECLRTRILEKLCQHSIWKLMQKLNMTTHLYTLLLSFDVAFELVVNTKEGYHSSCNTSALLGESVGHAGSFGSRWPWYLWTKLMNTEPQTTETQVAQIPSQRSPGVLSSTVTFNEEGGSFASAHSRLRETCLSRPKVCKPSSLTQPPSVSPSANHKPPKR